MILIFSEKGAIFTFSTIFFARCVEAYEKEKRQKQVFIHMETIKSFTQ